MSSNPKDIKKTFQAYEIMHDTLHLTTWCHGDCALFALQDGHIFLDVDGLSYKARGQVAHCIRNQHESKWSGD